ncbi:hypothetical protein ILYODFUR_002748 [Ilyodon furcidens]|uniref:Uncharacterized protein n=1 Tax=Ilyodon furcidens TaxID=33524 RepID=A0ABV0UGY7_9TELE
MLLGMNSFFPRFLKICLQLDSRCNIDDLTESFCFNFFYQFFFCCKKANSFLIEPLLECLKKNGPATKIELSTKLRIRSEPLKRSCCPSLLLRNLLFPFL